ncbi:MAG TPA: hypothetical protein VH413_02120 [Verrucomicrobiae bacterium]|jgi:hypothetical protein|nr:hypothetical protein [Verrucomicrobiae bacterium]
MNTNPAAPANLTNLSAANDIRALKPPIDIPNGWLWFWIILALVVIAVAAYFLWQRWRKKQDEPVIVPVIPPHERARQKLQEALALFSQPRPFCILVSDTVRQYLEERFNFHAPERTTEEFLHELRATDLLMPDQKESLGEFLSVCDMVKFARYEPGQPELQALHESAVRLVDETEPQPVVRDASTSTTVTA